MAVFFGTFAGGSCLKGLPGTCLQPFLLVLRRNNRKNQNVWALPHLGPMVPFLEKSSALGNPDDVLEYLLGTCGNFMGVSQIRGNKLC